MTKFSVVIPCHNSHVTLNQTLRSVRSQLDDSHQVIVLDDKSHVSSADVTKLLANEYRCQHVRNDEKSEWRGCLTTNKGVSLADNDLVHVLHPDDWVLDGFYHAVAQVADAHPSKALYATKHLVADENSVVYQAPAPRWLREGGKFQPLHEGNPLAVASCVIRKSFYQEHGGWNETLIHTADWEMWIRATTLGGAVDIDWPLAVYRANTNEGNHTSRLMREADNLRDCLKLADVVKQYAPDLIEMVKFRAHIAYIARKQEKWFRELQDFQAAEANAQFAREVESTLPPRSIKP